MVGELKVWDVSGLSLRYSFNKTNGGVAKRIYSFEINKLMEDSIWTFYCPFLIICLKKMATFYKDYPE
jgi:hypothetical protein